MFTTAVEFQLNSILAEDLKDSKSVTTDKFEPDFRKFDENHSQYTETMPNYAGQQQKITASMTSSRIWVLKIYKATKFQVPNFN